MVGIPANSQDILQDGCPVEGWFAQCEARVQTTHQIGEIQEAEIHMLQLLQFAGAHEAHSGYYVQVS